MKKTLFFALLCFSSLLMAQDETVYTVSSDPYLKTRTKEPKHKSSTGKIIGAKKSQAMGQSEIMIINPESRAKDLLSAIQFLKQRSPATKITVTLTDGSRISEILDVEAMPGGTLIIFKINTIKGQKYRVVKIENVDTLTHA